MTLQYKTLVVCHFLSFRVVLSVKQYSQWLLLQLSQKPKLLFFLTNKSNESIQYKRTHLPCLCAETADKCNKSHWMYIVCAYA